MSEALIMPSAGETAVKRAPTVYFIDDSATMREVIKIAFRRENINVITCADAASALAQFEQNRPDVVITDVIMPNQDGYAVCSQIKQHPEFGGIPVVLMSGVATTDIGSGPFFTHQTSKSVRAQMRYGSSALKRGRGTMKTGGGPYAGSDGTTANGA